MKISNRKTTGCSLQRCLAATLVIGVLAACSPGDGAGAESLPSSSANASAPGDRQAAASGEAVGVCALLTPSEIEATFSGAIQVVVDSDGERVCDYRILGHEGQILLQRMDAQTYKDRKAMYAGPAYRAIEQTAVAGLGQDAYTMGNAQVEVLVDHQEGFNLSLVLLTAGAPPMTQEQARSALVELAGTAAKRL